MNYGFNNPTDNYFSGLSGYGNLGNMGGMQTKMNPWMQSPDALTGFGGTALGSQAAAPNSMFSGLSGLLGDHGKTILGGLGSLGSMWMGMRQYGLAKDALDFQKEQYERNFQAQAQMTNSRLRDRQIARNAVSSGGHQSVDDYMAANTIR